jgi:site-specific DNA recombinase
MTTAQQVLLYARISKLDKHVPKVPDQLDTLRALAKHRGWRVVGEFADDGISASNGDDRPAWDQLLTQLGNHRGAVILATEEARLARNEMEKAGLISFCANAGVRWETVRDGAVDPATAAGALMGTIRGAVDSFEVRRKAERQRDANQHAAERGEPSRLTRRAFGFEPDGCTPRQPEAQLIAEATRTLLETGTLWPVVKSWNRAGVRTATGRHWTYASAQAVLSRWRNAGWTERAGQPVAPWSAGRHGIVTFAEVEAVRKVLADPTRAENRQFEPVALCSGIAQCVCGATMIAARMNAAPGYRCGARIRGDAKPGTHTSIRRNQLDPMVRDTVIYYYAQHAHDGAVVDAEAVEIARLRADLAEIERRLSELTKAMEAGSFTAAQVAKPTARLRVKAEQLKAAIDEHARSSAHAAMLQGSFDYFTKHLREKGSAEGVHNALGTAFDKLDLTSQRRLVQTLLTITVHPGRTVDRVEIYFRTVQ